MGLALNLVTALIFIKVSGGRRRQGSLAMIHTARRPIVHMPLVALKFALGHNFFRLFSVAGARPAAPFKKRAVHDGKSDGGASAGKSLLPARSNSLLAFKPS
jgi:hypothetical protein